MTLYVATEEFFFLELSRTTGKSFQPLETVSSLITLFSHEKFSKYLTKGDEPVEVIDAINLGIF